MKKNLQDVCVRPDAPLQSVLLALQTSVYGICLVVEDNQKILGTITDGDCRRALLRGNAGQLTASEIMHKDFVVVDSSFSLSQIKMLMRANSIKQVPIVDGHNRVVDLVSAQTIDRPKHPRPVSALILAGGKGKRLRPLTEALPKPMLPVGGRPMMERLVEQLVSHGIKDIHISVNYLGHIIEDYFQDGSKWGCRINYVRETVELGTAGPLRLLEGKIENPFIVVNGDLVTAVDFSACIDFHMEHRFHLTMGVSTYKIQVPFGVVSVGPGGEVREVVEKPTEAFTINAGIYAIDPAIIPLIPDGTSFPMTALVDAAIAASYNVGAFPIHEMWADVGLPEQYNSLKDATTE